jgi:hypothetical protein
VGIFAIRFFYIPVHAFDQSLNLYGRIPVEQKIVSMAKRARMDAYLYGFSPIGRGRLITRIPFRHGSDYDLSFEPTYVSDLNVVYRFKKDGTPLWKACTATAP